MYLASNCPRMRSEAGETLRVKNWNLETNFAYFCAWLDALLSNLFRYLRLKQKICIQASPYSSLYSGPATVDFCSCSSDRWTCAIWNIYPHTPAHHSLLIACVTSNTLSTKIRFCQLSAVLFNLTIPKLTVVVEICPGKTCSKQHCTTNWTV